MNINSISDFRKAIRNGKYAWPGGYPMYFVQADGEVISFEVASYERRNCICAISSRQPERIVAFETNWEDPALYCAASGERIESAYAEDEVSN